MKNTVTMFLIGVLLMPFFPILYAHNPGGVTLPDECKPFVEDTEFVHVFDVSIFPIPTEEEPIFVGTMLLL